MVQVSKKFNFLIMLGVSQEKLQVIRKLVDYCDRFFPAEHEYQSHFSYHLQVFRNFMSKLSIINIGIFQWRILYV